jgi:predicted transposase YdaD
METIHTPHDNLFKSAMADLRVARDFFEHNLPPAVLQAVDLKTLKMSPNSYVDISLSDSASDILYKVEIAKKPAYLYLLCEHQSTVDPLMPFRLWQYIVGIWSDHLKQSKPCEETKSKRKKTDPASKKPPLPLVIPMVFYHGPGAYTGPLHIRSLIDGPSELIEQLLGPFHLIDTHVLSDEALREQKWAGIMTFVMKHIYVRDIGVILQSLIERFQQLAREADSIEYKSTLLHYVLNVGDTAEPKVFLQAIEAGLSASEGEGTMTIASRLIDIGVQQGRQEGQQQERTHFLLSLLERKFGVLPTWYHNRIQQASSEQLLNWGAKLLETDSLEALFEGSYAPP